MYLESSRLQHGFGRRLHFFLFKTLDNEYLKDIASRLGTHQNTYMVFFTFLWIEVERFVMYGQICIYIYLDFQQQQ